MSTTDRTGSRALRSASRSPNRSSIYRPPVLTRCWLQRCCAVPYCCPRDSNSGFVKKFSRKKITRNNLGLFISIIRRVMSIYKIFWVAVKSTSPLAFN